MDALLDPGTLLRTLHLWSAAAFTGLIVGVDAVLGPLLLDTGRSGRLRSLAPLWLGAVRWTGALAWATGTAYGLGWLARQDPAGAGHWFVETQRGQWVTLAFALASAAVFLAWFVAAPRWEQLARRSRAGEPHPHPLERAWQLQARVATRLAAALTVPLLFAMGAARHLGETGGDLPTDMGDTALAVTLVGTVLGLLPGALGAWLVRRALAR